MYELLKGVDEELKGGIWDVRNLPGFKGDRDAAMPFVVGLGKLRIPNGDK